MPQVMALQESVAASGAIKVPAAADVRRPVSTGRTWAGAGGCGGPSRPIDISMSQTLA